MTKAGGDVGLVLVCVLAGALVGATYYRHVLGAGGKPWFYQVDFGPAVMVACGHDFVVPDAAAIPALARFLNQEVGEFSCDDLPPQPPVRRVTGAQPWLMWSHLLRSAAAIWSVTGVAWSNLAPLAGAFYGATVALVFLIMRLVAGPVVSVAGAIAVLSSPLFLDELPQFRDFSKVPFMLGLAWLLSRLAGATLSTQRLLGTAAAYGAVLGVGIGFRNDLFITIPPFILLILVAPLSTTVRRLRLRLAALLIASVAFAIPATPVLRVYADGGGASMAHAALLGMMSPIDTRLGLSNSGLYEVGHGLEDSYAAAVISSFASRSAGMLTAIDGHSRDYDTAASDYFRALVSLMPADALARGFGAADRVIALPSSEVETKAPPYIESRWLRRFYEWRSRIALSVWWVWLPTVAAALLLVSMRNLRLAWLLTVLCAYFTAYPAIQFNTRHVLHLELIPLVAAGFVAQTLIDRRWQGHWRNAAMLAVFVVILIVAPLVVSRRVQTANVASLLEGYQTAAHQTVALRESELPDGRIALNFDDGLAPPSPPGSVASEYLIADFDSSPCGAAAADLTLRYETSHSFADFSRRMTVSLAAPGQVTRVMLASYAYQSSPSDQGEPIRYQPRGFEMLAAHRSCLVRLVRLVEPNRFPVLLNATLPPDWQQLPPYLTLTRWESRKTSSLSRTYLAPPTLRLDRGTVDRGALIRQDEMTDLAPNVSMPAAGAISIRGAGGIGGLSPYAYLARLAPRTLRSGDRLMVDGILRQGGITLGWINGGQWVSQLAITEPGPFVVALEADRDGTYEFVIANNLQGASQRNSVEMTGLRLTRREGVIAVGR